MAALFDVAARLADGRSAVEDAHTYVSAARQRGYSNPELTDLASWYDTERGLDLQRLDADRAALETAARAATEAVDLARAALAALVRAWNGPGAQASVEFVRRHCDSAAAVADALTLAAQTCAALREDLWRAVDAKVAATTAIAERVGTRRESWLSAAQAVLAGTPDEAAAEIVDAQVAPFVATALANDWLRDMRTTTESARETYRRAVDVLGQWRGAQFEVPGDLGPRPAPEVPQAALQAPAPAAFPAPAPLPTLPQAAPPPGMGEAIPAPPAASPGPAPIPDLGAAAGIPGGIADALGGLDPRAGGTEVRSPDLNELDPPELDPPELDPPELGELDETPDEEVDEPADTDPEDTDAEESAEEEREPEELGATEPDPEPEPGCDQSAPAPAPAPPPPPVPEPTPCEMAADELPQVGE